MKHTLKITLLLLLIFVLAEIIGLFIVQQYIDVHQTQQSGEVVFKPLPFQLERPEIEESSSYGFIFLGVLLGTALLLFLIKFKRMGLWKVWYFLAVVAALTFAFKPFLEEHLALLLGLFLGFLKVRRPHVFIHNLTEVFLYGGLAAIFVPLLNVFSAIILLLLISGYDMLAVWKLKHMITMAEFQTKSQLFAGFFIPYQKTIMPQAEWSLFPDKQNYQKKATRAKKTPEKNPLKEKKQRRKKGTVTAILGGGDIAFPLLFMGAVMKSLVQQGMTLANAFQWTSIILIPTTLALAGLFFFAKEKRFYPAMPFLSLGCFLGYGLLQLLL